MKARIIYKNFIAGKIQAWEKAPGAWFGYWYPRLLILTHTNYIIICEASPTQKHFSGLFYSVALDQDQMERGIDGRKILDVIYAPDAYMIQVSNTKYLITSSGDPPTRTTNLVFPNFSSNFSMFVTS